MAPSFDLERVGEEQDRSATFALLERLADPGVNEDERDEIANTMGRLADPRSFPRLIDVAEDRTAAASVRRAAMSVFFFAGLTPEGDVVRRWWASGDEQLRKEALLCARRTEADLVRPVAGDPSHPLHEEAIRGIGDTFEEPEWHDWVVAALGHSSAVIREVAAITLMWSEPFRAEAALHRAAHDVEPAVAVAAIEALEYYPSRSTALLLADMARSGRDETADAAGRVLEELREGFRAALTTDSPAQERLRRWMEPVWEVLRLGDEGAPEDEIMNPAVCSGSERLVLPSPEYLMTLFDDPDGPWSAKLAVLRDYRWATVPQAMREGLSRFFPTHPDPEVRLEVCRALAIWKDTGRLLELAHDPVYMVRKSAIYHLEFVPPSGEVGRLTWDLIATGEVGGVRGHETLRTYSVHAPAPEVKGHLIELARGDLRESLRYEAVNLLDRDVGPVLHLLTEPPLVTWAVHTELLRICANHGLTLPPVAHLREVDNLDVARELAELDG